MQISFETIIILVFALIIIFFLLYIFMHMKSLHTKIENIQDLYLKKESDLKELLYNRLESQSKTMQEQNEKSIKTTNEMILFLEKMQSNINITLRDRFTLMIEKLQTSIKEQQEKSAKDFESLSFRIDQRLEKINEKVENRLKSGFENIDKTFKEIIVGIAKINEAQKVIESLSTEVNSLQLILTDKKTRGIFGEVQLNSILKSIFGEKKELYDIQYTLQNGFICDAIIKAPEPVGLVAIDSKFPLENYRRMSEDKSFQNEFRNNLKKHINDISTKYIIQGQTASIAILFLPAEAIFAEIYAYHESLIDYAREKNVWIASPTTLMALLTTITAIVRDIKTQEQAKKIQEELMKLSRNFKLYKQRWETLSKHIDTVHKDVREISITTTKISNEFDRIEKVEFDDEPLKIQ